MSKIVLLDSGPLGMATNPKATPISLECRYWLESLKSKGYKAMVPEIADYEVRRELIRAGKLAGIRKLDGLKATTPYLPITTEAMLKAAELWARAPQQGTPTADPKEIDGDVILAAQATVLTETEGNEVIVATTNVGHLSLFVDAREWRLI